MSRRPRAAWTLLAASLVLVAPLAAAEPPAAPPVAATPTAPAAPPAPPAPSMAEPRSAAVSAPGSSPLAEAGVKLLLGSVVLAALLYVGSRLVRRLPLGRLLPSAEGPIRLAARTQLGAKESLCLVQVGPTALLLAVTAQSIHPLHVWPEGVGAAPARGEGPAAVGRASTETGGERSTLPGQLRALEAWLSVTRR